MGYDKEVVMVRHGLTDEQWEIVSPYLSRQKQNPKGKGGRPRRDPREMLDGVLWTLVTGAAWRDLPESFGPWETVYSYFANWQKTGVIDAIAGALLVRLDEQGGIDWSSWCVDGTSIRAGKAAAGAALKV